jgi:hypothetical protein
MVLPLPTEVSADRHPRSLSRIVFIYRSLGVKSGRLFRLYRETNVPDWGAPANPASPRPGVGKKFHPRSVEEPPPCYANTPLARATLELTGRQKAGQAIFILGKRAVKISLQEKNRIWRHRTPDMSRNRGFFQTGCRGLRRYRGPPWQDRKHSHKYYRHISSFFLPPIKIFVLSSGEKNYMGWCRSVSSSRLRVAK